MKHQNIRMARSLEECNAITHDGTFHGDDVFGAAIISLMTPVMLLRTRDQSIISEKKTHAIIFDVGAEYESSSLMFDHHQKGFDKARANGTLYASAGLLWDMFGEEILRTRYDCPEDFLKDVRERVDRNLIEGIDAQDNGLTQFHVGMTISGFMSLYNPNWDDENTSSNGEFIAAAHEAKKILHRTILSAISVAHGKQFVREAIEKNNDSEVLVLPRFVGGWPSAITNLETAAAKSLKYVVYRTQDTKQQWGAYGVPVYAPDDRKVRLPFPEEWRGQNQRVLSRITGISGALYCHPEGHYATANSEEGALELARLAIGYSKVKENETEGAEATEVS